MALIGKFENRQMIFDPRYITDGYIESPINLGLSVDPYGEGAAGRFIRGQQIKGVTWMYHGKPITLFFNQDVHEIRAYPTPDMKFMVVLVLTRLWEGRQNAIFFDATGVEVFRPHLPQLKSWDEQVIQNGFFRFENVFWSVRKDFMEFWIERKNDDFFEWRYFNYKTLQWDEENWLHQRY